MFTKLICLGVLAVGAAAQDIPYEVKYNLTGFTYPRVGRLARVQGVVKLELIPTEAGQEVNVVSGHAMLVQAAKNNLAKWRTNQPVTVNYIFRLGDPDISKTRVPKGDAFDRMILRMFRLATYTVEYHCKQSIDKLAEPRVAQQWPLIIDVEIVGGTNCLQTETSLVAAR